MFDFSKIKIAPYPLTFPRVEKEVQEARMDICKTCENFVMLKFCNQCGCYMPFKTELKSAECPQQKW